MGMALPAQGGKMAQNYFVGNWCNSMLNLMVKSMSEHPENR